MALLLTQSFLQTFLSTAFSVDPAYVVPKQGNWYNPQAAEKDGSKTNTWCAYLVKKSRARTIPYFELADSSTELAPVSASTVPTISYVDFQLVGSEAETASLSAMHWLNRPDLLKLLNDNGMQLMADRVDIIVSHFMQDGMNNVLAYNGTFSIQWDNFVTTGQTKVTSVTLPLTNGALVVNS